MDRTYIDIVNRRLTRTAKLLVNEVSDPNTRTVGLWVTKIVCIGMRPDERKCNLHIQHPLRLLPSFPGAYLDHPKTWFTHKSGNLSYLLSNRWSGSLSL